MRAVELLLEDHRDIEQLLAILAGARARLRNGEPLDRQVVQKVAEAMYEYADKYHHVREEEHIFPVLERYPLLTLAGQLGCMPGEHEIGRELTRVLREAGARYAEGDDSVSDQIVDAAGKYLMLLGHHMGVEEGILFELADRVVSDEDDEAMATGLDQAAAAYRGTETDISFRALLEELRPYAITPQEAASTLNPADEPVCETP